MPCTAKKTTKLIVEGGNDYVITVKGNQPRLLKQLKTITETQNPCERFVDIEKARGLITCRIVKVFTELKNINFDWVGVDLSEILNYEKKNGKTLNLVFTIFQY